MASKNEAGFQKELKQWAVRQGHFIRKTHGSLYADGWPDSYLAVGWDFWVETKSGNPPTYGRLANLVRPSQKAWIRGASPNGSRVYIAVRNRHSARWAFVWAADCIDKNQADMPLTYYETFTHFIDALRADAFRRLFRQANK